MTAVEILKNHEIRRHASIILNQISKGIHCGAASISEYRIDEENNAILLNIDITPLHSSDFITYTRKQIIKAKKNIDNTKNRLFLLNLRDALIKHTTSVIYTVVSGYEFYIEFYQKRDCGDFDCSLSFTIKYFTPEEGKSLLMELDDLERITETKPIEPSDVDYARA